MRRDRDGSGESDGLHRSDLAKARVNEERFAAANVQIAEKAKSLQMNDRSIPFLCECSDLRWTKIIQLSLAEFQATKAKTGAFILLAGHDDANVERVIDKTDGYVLVEKLTPPS